MPFPSMPIPGRAPTAAAPAPVALPPAWPTPRLPDNFFDHAPAPAPAAPAPLPVFASPMPQPHPTSHAGRWLPNPYEPRRSRALRREPLPDLGLDLESAPPLEPAPSHLWMDDVPTARPLGAFKPLRADQAIDHEREKVPDGLLHNWLSEAPSALAGTVEAEDNAHRSEVLADVHPADEHPVPAERIDPRWPV